MQKTSDIEIQALIKIIETKSGVKDLTSPMRNRYVVMLRRVFYKILRDRGVSFDRMSSFLKQDHATAIHACKKIEVDMMYEKWMAPFMNECINSFNEIISFAPGDEEIGDLTYKQMYEASRNELMVINTVVKSQQDLIDSLRAALSESRKDSSRLHDLFSMVSARCPIGMERILYNKVYRILNEKLD
jgi:hypothetical protein